MAVLSLNNVKKSYKLGDGTEFPVLKGINVSFEKGELVSIIGESGSGKSTLMNIIGGLDSKFEGEVLVDGKNIGSFTEKELDIYRKNKIGFIFQSLSGLTDEFVDSQYEQLFHPGIATYSYGFCLLLQSLLRDSSCQ